MIAANQGAFISRFKQATLQIREKELNYFNSSFQTFGTQAAMISGFAYASIGAVNIYDPVEADGTCRDPTKSVHGHICESPNAVSVV